MYVCHCHAVTDGEIHVGYLETQLDLIQTPGEPLYIAQLIEQPED